MSRTTNKFQQLTDMLASNNILYYLEEAEGDVSNGTHNYTTPNQRGQILANLEKLEEEISQLKSFIRAN